MIVNEQEEVVELGEDEELATLEETPFEEEVLEDS